MKRISITLFFLLFLSTAQAQLISGTLIDEGRKLASPVTFILEDQNEGFIYYELAVNRMGEVTSAKLVDEGTTVVSTPSRMKVRDHVVKFKFDDATYYPAFQHVIVKITLVAPKND